MVGRGRTPCCDKSQVKRGPWSPSEDLRLISFIQKHGHDNWRALPKQAGLLRCGKSCRLRWINYLRPDLKRGNFTKEEEESIIMLHEAWGNKWSKIASHFPGRTDNEIKNVWNTHLRKKLALKYSCGDYQSKELSSITSSSSSSSSSSASFQLSSGEPSAGVTAELQNQPNQESNTSKTRNDCELPNSLTIQEKLEKKLPMEVTDQVRVDDAVGMKMLTTSSSFSSYASSNGSSSSQGGGVSRPDDLVFDLKGAYEPQIADKAVFEIPFESDYGFWNMLDGTLSFEGNPEPLLPQADQTYQSSNLELVESGNWLSYLEKELGLEDSTKTNNQDFVMKDATEQLASEKYCDKLPKPTEMDHGMDDYFGMWPPLPENSAN